MEKLVNSGLPLYIDEETHVVALSAQLDFGGYGRKYVTQMLGLLADENNLNDKELAYDVYRGIAFPEHQDLLNKHDYRYDITIIMPGLVNGECKKTSGHYHGYGLNHTNTFGEVYEVIKGTALYILQKSPDFDSFSEDITLEDVILVTVQEGQSIIVPPNYGHASVNIGTGPLVFSNLAVASCPIDYEPVKKYHGMAYYIYKEEGVVKAVMNDKHQNVVIPSVKKAVVKENKKFGIEFGKPIYQSFIENPDAFDFLGNPDDKYLDDIYNMLVFE